eukprot:GHVR01173755.1.p1 GENE.GHVR01173755.1~~GHVR01173755.1.p1  ORF type:complete len:140 (+),score=34.62 GHVR01173755.1:138-557(+)
MSAIAKRRLMLERQQWRQDHPAGFVAKYKTDTDGKLDIFKWDCKIPGKKGTLWEGGVYTLTMDFPDEYPGTVCLSILNEDEDWKPSITVKHILLGVQDLLGSPNPDSPAQAEPFQMFQNNREEYAKRVKSFAASCRPTY